MSDEIVRHASNLCTSEDAFEQFQSNAMHQDDDFITLSDIVSPGPVVPDLANELNEIPYDNEVELSSNIDETSHVNNPPSAICEEIVQSVLIPHTSSSTLVSPEITPHIEKPNNNKKRGRKKKTIHSTIEATPNSDISHGDTPHVNTKQHEGPSADEQDTESLLEIIHTKRGRRVRQPNTLLKRDYVANTPRKANTETKRKRGRPRKQQPDGTLQEADSTNHNNASSNESSSFKQIFQSRTRKTNMKRKPKKPLQEATEQLHNDVSSSGVSYRDDDHLDDVALSELTSKASEKLEESSAAFGSEQNSDKPVNNCTETKEANANKQLNGVNDISPAKITKSPVKRGRQKKEIRMYIVKDQETTDVSIGDINNDVKDDESLNKKMEVDVEIPSQETFVSPIDSQSHDGSHKRNAKMPLMTDFEYNLDSVVQTTREPDETNKPNETFDNSDLLIEDTSKRPSRSKARKILHYDDGSDEDPFANVELSDDDEPRRKGTKYYSDDEYVPHHDKNKRKAAIGTSSESEDEMILGDQLLCPKRKAKKSDCNIPKKRGRKSKDLAASGAISTQEVEDSDSAVQPTTNSNWGASNEFESFIAKKIQGTNLKIKKLSSSTSSENVLAPLAIPTITANAAKDKIDISCQTKRVSTVTTAIQTSNPHDVPLKENITLTMEQSQEACKFLLSVVTTTAELGQLMTQKSEDFIKKKINSSHVVDTSTMDYCVKKSYLLFKLAKHNLLQMEEELAKQYEEFLQTHNLSNCREEIKKLEPKPIIEDNDSDCEIVDVSPANPKEKPKEKPKFNPKTVFLNKELSIKIAKKPTDTKKPQEEKKVNVKGRHTVWINDSIMVKKVTPNQSFLAEDSRNQKPPDKYVTEKMVSDFFMSYERQKALAICSPFTTTEWKSLNQTYVCNYFVVQPNDTYNLNCLDNNNIEVNSMENSNVANNLDTNHSTQKAKSTEHSSPKKLFTLCIQNMQKHLDMIQVIKKVDHDQSNKLTEHETNQERPLSLVGMCLGVINSASAPKPNYEDSILESISTHDGTTLFPLQDSTPPKSDSPDIGTPFFPCEDSTSTPTEYISTHVGATVNSLKTLCYRVIVKLLYKETSSSNETLEEDFVEYDVITKEDFDIIKPNEQNDSVKFYSNKNGFKTLFSLCLELIQSEQIERLDKEVANNIPDSISEVNSLKHIAFEYIRTIIYESNTRCCPSDFNVEIIPTSIEDGIPIEGLTINAINTMSEEAFHNIEGAILDTHEDDMHYSDNEESHCYEDELVPDDDVEDDAATEDNNWVSQVQMQEFRSCSLHNTENDNIQFQQENVTTALIKLEPLEETCDDVLDTSVIVKREPVNCFDEMINIPDDIITKTEILEQPGRILERVNSNSYDENLFETFVSSHKIIQGTHLETEGVFSQSALRVRRQFEPDCDEDNDTSMSLLVPQAFEPLHIVQAKGCLMESSSDDDASGKKTKGKKKIDKRKGKQKKTDLKTSNKDAVPNVKEKAGNEVSLLTKKMRERIRHEKKTINSSDSETDQLSNISGKDKKSNDTSKASGNPNDENDEIQCNNVDSTEQFGEFVGRTNTPVAETFTGFSADDLVEVNTFEKYRKHIFETEKAAAIAKESEDAKCANENEEMLYSLDQPAELLECEPTLPVFEQPQSKRRKKVKENVNVQLNLNSEQNPDTLNPVLSIEKHYTDRHGWQCYPVNSSDPKLYESAVILLEKLPESFVETYLTYQEMIDKNEEDIEIDRLINLNSLNRTPNVKDPMIRNKGKDKGKPEGLAGAASEDFRAESPIFSDHCAELTPSEDEGANVDDEVPVEHATDNNLAKNSLMDDENSESEGEGVTPVKKEPGLEQTLKANKPCPKSKKTEEVHNAEDFVLTADKTMNKELTLLHAPTGVKPEPADAALSGPSTRLRQKNPTKKSPKDRVRTEGDSSSDDEKREKWVNTKEKLLKRVQRTEDASIQDAKRAKLVNDFIVKRGGDAPDRKYRGRGRRSYKKFLEREKQLRVLSKELFGESSGDAIPGSKRSSAAPFKGRRNIRKVIDKKSLTRSTVLANMEEFERKRRLNIRQSRLRELMGCEEGVNVLVINDEVCLEYDFEENRPVVTVHPFFTKVMKAHQYEGVKFMWDACFESLEKLSSGHGGGGCILAHCMGLGKTLQVLALLHTILTHPGVGMQRILVCCPLSTVLNWVDEIHKWIGPVTDQIKVFELSKLKKTYQRAYQLEDWYEGGGIFIIGYELFRSLSTLDPVLDGVRPAIVNKIRKALLDPGPDIIVCDEGHLLKNDASVLAVAMSRVVTKRRIVLTGTPMQNNLREYYCMVNFIKPNLLGTYSEYSNRFENPIMNGQHRDSSEEDIRLMKARTHILHKVLEGCLQRQEASVLYPYLPKKHEYTVFVPLTKCQWNLYKHYLNFYANDNKNSVLRDFHILQKIWSHPQVLHNFQTKRQDAMKNKVKVEKLEEEVQEELSVPMEHTGALDDWWLPYVEDGATLDDLATSNKFLVVFRILHECVQLGDKVLIFSTSLFCLDTLEFFLKKINKWALGHEYYRLDGSVPAEVRQKWCREFNAENNVMTKLFLISTRAGCLGLNMTGANRVIILDTSWNPAHDIQSIFRVYRFGQKKDCYIYRLVALGSMEQKIYERSVTKQAVACRVVDEQQIERHYNMAELTELYKFDEKGCNVAGGVAVGVSDVVLLRVARDAPLHAVHEHDSLLRGSSEQGLPEHERAAAWMQFQQEHAHKQRQNEIDTERENMIKHMKTHDYVQMHTNNMAPNHVAVKVEPNNGPSAFSLPPEPKGKKGKRGVVKCTIPIQKAPQQATSSTAEVDPARKLKEDEIVKRIINIILRHNFHTTTQGPKEISKLVESVRHIMHNGPAQFMNSSDELASSIANVLMQSESCSQSNFDVQRTTEPAPALAPLPNPVPEPTNDNVVEIQDAEVSKYAEEVTGRVKRPSTKRKSALIAESRMESVVREDSINVPDDNDEDYSQLADDDYHRSDDGDYDSGDNQPLQQPERPKSPPRVITEKKKKIKKEVKPPSPPAFRVYSGSSVADEVAKTANSSQINFIDSIVLSDDDDPPSEVAKLKPGPASKKKKTEVKKEIIEKKTDIDKTNGSESEKVPLHPTLLLNPNFIKIVAHTYLSGNPMLAEDAAILAAQYSTNKAHREAAATGNPIISGPIYDIAVNVLGISVLKKLHDNTAKVMIPNNSNDARERASKKNRSLLHSKSDVGKTVTPVSLTRTKDMASGKSQANEVRAIKVVASEVCDYLAAASTSPRPVGLISRVQSGEPRAPSTPSSAGECILPDEAAPRAAPAVTLLPSGRLLLAPPGPHPNNVRLVAPTPAPSITANMPNASQLRVVGKTDTGQRIFAVAAKQPVAASAVAESARCESATICLDSDEETPEVVPVSLSINPAHPLAGVPDSNTVSPYRTAIAPYPNAVSSYPTAVAPYPTAIAPYTTAAASYSAAAACYSTAAASPTTVATPATARAPTPPMPAAPDQTPDAISKCRPGDILRLTKSGKIEIVSRSGQLESTTKAPLVAPKTTRPGASDPLPAPKTTAVPAKPPSTSAITPKNTVSQRSRSSSSSSSSDDPLSILKDVVQIQAANDVPSKTRLSVTPGTAQRGAVHAKPQEKFKFPPIAPRPPSTVRTNTKTSTIASSSRAAPPATPVKAKQVESRAQNKPKEQILLNKTLTKSHVSTSGTKTKATVNATIDLTATTIDVDRASNARPATSAPKAGVRGSKVPDGKKPADSKKIAAPPKILNNTVSGTSRELLLDGKSIKLIPASPTINLVESSNIIKIKEMKTITKSNGLLKRYTHVPDASAPKKKKLSEMTLKDFDIDDIDDIIELE